MATHLRVTVTIILLMPKAHIVINGQNLTVVTSHAISGILNSKVQSDSGSVFKAAASQWVSKALGIEYHTVPGDPNLQNKLKRLITLLKDMHINELREHKTVGLHFYPEI